MLVFDVLFVIACFVLLVMSVHILSDRAERCRSLALDRAAQAKNLGEELQICQDIANSVPGWQTRADLYSEAARAVRALRNQFESITVADPEEIRAMQDQLSKVTEERDEARATIAGLEAQVEQLSKSCDGLAEQLNASRKVADDLRVAAEKGRAPLYDVVLRSRKEGSVIPLIKEVRSYFSLGLKEAKDLVDNMPSFLGQGVTGITAQSIKCRFEAAGGIVTVRKVK
jgi:ribosomal protein L7/L12